MPLGALLFTKMQKKLVSINLKKLNIYSIFLFAIPLLICIVLKVLLPNNYNLSLGLYDYLIVIIGCPLLFAMHEVIHAIAFFLAGVPIKYIRFGVIPKKFMLYCSVSQKVTPKAYSLSLIMPFIFLGIIPWALSMIFLNWKYSFLFAILISGSCGDLMMLTELLKYKNVKFVEDHPSLPAFYLLFDDDDFKTIKDDKEEDEKALIDEYYGK